MEPNDEKLCPVSEVYGVEDASVLRDGDEDAYKGMWY